MGDKHDFDAATGLLKQFQNIMALSFEFDMMKRLGLLLIIVFSYSAHCQDYTPEICIPLNTSEENLKRLIQTIDSQKKQFLQLNLLFKFHWSTEKKGLMKKINMKFVSPKKLGLIIRIQMMV